ncbi:hypothetical protein FA95DRAFT_1612907 [Auriscalpium vulgare]|uniref:Uncharacterized protein n=1 Tax=Auriscalpium vulgare TaxID=40419 RepID=A0ACB8R623_9AGAM|nr:hypothetical protein FA95DRAFT_1612907 [Auriscalpium vulgare]
MTRTTRSQQDKEEKRSAPTKTAAKRAKAAPKNNAKAASAPSTRVAASKGGAADALKEGLEASPSVSGPATRGKPARATPAGRTKSPAKRKAPTEAAAEENGPQKRRKGTSAAAADTPKKKQKSGAAPANKIQGADEDTMVDVVVDVTNAVDVSDSGSDFEDEEEDEDSDETPEADEEFGIEVVESAVNDEEGPVRRQRKKSTKAVEKQFNTAVPRWTSATSVSQAPAADSHAVTPSTATSTRSKRSKSAGAPQAKTLRVDSGNEPAFEVAAPPIEDALESTGDALREGPGQGAHGTDMADLAASPAPSVDAIDFQDEQAGVARENRDVPWEESDEEAPSRVSPARRAPSVSTNITAPSAPSIPSIDAHQASPIDNTNSDGAWPASTKLVFPNGGAKMRIRAQPADVKKVIRRAVHEEMPEAICFKNAFPSALERPALLHSACIKAAEHEDAQQVLARLKADVAYSRGMCIIPDARISNLRGKVKEAADGVVKDRYQLNTDAIPADRFVQHVKKLLDSDDDDYLYIFPAAPGSSLTSLKVDTTRPFCHPAIIEVLHRSFFGSKAAAKFAIEKYINIAVGDEPELPAAMVALASTAVHAGIDAFRFGAAETIIVFDGNKYTEIFKNHLRTLDDIRDEDEQVYSVLMANLFKKASGVTSGSRGSGIGPSSGRANRRVKASNIAKTFD